MNHVPVVDCRHGRCSDGVFGRMGAELHGQSRGGAGIGLGRARLRQGPREYELPALGRQSGEDSRHAGGGAYVRFGQAQAKFSDLSIILVSHLHPDHSSDLPGVLWSGRNTRNDTLPIAGPSGNDAAPALNDFLTRLFDPKSGSWEVLSSVVAPGPGVKLDPRVVDVTRQEPTTVYDRDGVKVSAMGIPHGNLPTVAYRVETQGVTVVLSSDQNGTNPRFPDFAKGADILLMHLAIGVNAKNPNQALPAVVGSVAQSANPKRLVLSHIGNFDLDAAVTDVKKNYSGPLTIGADLQCTQAK